MILTGGDPLMLAPRRLAKLIAALDAIDHVGVIRIHSRVPIVDPSRVTDELVAALKPRPRRAVVRRALQSCPRAQARGARRPGTIGRCRHSLMGQTVLLAGVNDDVETLDALMRALVARG